MAPWDSFGRRDFLAGGMGLLALSGCGTRGALAAAVPSLKPAVTFTDLIGADPFYVAHRGGGANWPEMTAYAYSQAAALPWVNAIEISVCLSSDGVLVCSHDATTLRMTGVDHEISTVDWATLSTLQVTAAFTDNPGQPARPLSRFDDVIEQYLPRLVVFAEPKTPQAIEPLMARLKQLAQPDRTVWKQPINQPNFARAKANGFHTWGYVLDEPGHLGERLPGYAASPDIDMLGIEKTEPDAVVSRVVGLASQNGKATMMWAIADVAERTRGLTLGCRGMMTSNIRDVPPVPR
ncbi:MAG: glycerophosphodiester phosphodiesterase [Propionicimonas sp.]